MLAARSQQQPQRSANASNYNTSAISGVAATAAASTTSAQAKQQQQQGARENSANNNSATNYATATATAATTTDTVAARPVTLRGLQEVFSSSLVSTASLDYLSVSNIIDEDYADIR